MAILQIKNLHVTVETEQGTKEILKGVDLVIRSGETHAIMGPNGSGKSTLAYTIAGHPKYTVTEGEILLDGENVLEMSVDERARAGLFLAMQYPVEIPGVNNAYFLKAALNAKTGKLKAWAATGSLPAPRANAVAVLQADAWPGNVRQLQNVLFRAVTMCERSVLRRVLSPAPRSTSTVMSRSAAVLGRKPAMTKASVPTEKVPSSVLRNVVAAPPAAGFTHRSVIVVVFTSMPRLR